MAHVKRSLSVAVLGIALLAGGCGSGDAAETESSAPAAGASSAPAESDETVECVPLSEDVLSQVADGLTDKSVSITKGAAVELPAEGQEFNYRYAVALQVKAADAAEVVIMGMGGTEPESAGPIIAADNLARLYFDWGAAATHGSPIDQYRDALFTSDAASEASDCLK